MCNIQKVQVKVCFRSRDFALVRFPATYLAIDVILTFDYMLQNNPTWSISVS